MGGNWTFHLICMTVRTNTWPTGTTFLQLGNFFNNVQHHKIKVCCSFLFGLRDHSVNHVCQPFALLLVRKAFNFNCREIFLSSFALRSLVRTRNYFCQVSRFAARWRQELILPSFAVRPSRLRNFGRNNLIDRESILNGQADCKVVKDPLEGWVHPRRSWGYVTNMLKLREC